MGPRRGHAAMGTLALLAVIGAAFGGLGAYVAAQRRREVLEGFALGSSFGPLVLVGLSSFQRFLN